MGYVRDHWRGRHTLARAFWINFLIPFVLIAMGEPWIRPAPDGGTAAEVTLAALYILVAHGVVLPWQAVGLWRSSRRHLRERGEMAAVTFAQGALLIALVTAAGATTTTIQHIFGLGVGTAEVAGGTPPRHVLTVLPDERAIRLEGQFDNGLSRDLRAVLAEAPETGTIILNSDGGRVFEARGVARQILDNELDTRVDGRCRSACTIAFIAGKRRALSEGSLIGFHRYRMDAAMGFSDPMEEQEKDKAFFKSQGVLADFVERVFAKPHEDMWHPEVDELLDGGVVHELIADRDR